MGSNKTKTSLVDYLHVASSYPSYLLRLPDTYEAKIVKIGNFWTF